MKALLRIIAIFSVCVLFALSAAGEANNLPDINVPEAKAAVIVCKGMIDDGLYKSVRRRTEMALAGGAEYLIYEISTYGGLLQSGDDISKYLILEAGKKAHTVAYITTEAISAGAMISVSCQDIVMLENTTIGDCAPIAIGTKLEGVEREKTESFTRAAFMRASEANGYPEALLKAMVTMQIEVYRVKNLQSGKYEFFEGDKLPADPKKYELGKKELIVGSDEILTLTASQAFEYGIARATVSGLDGVMEYLAKRDGVTFAGEPMVLKTTWSEEMVRWVNSPAVMGILVMIALLGVYIEFNTPGAVLPAAVAGICFVIIIGSKYLVGLANWVEVALFFVGVLLLLIEIFVLPGFGIAGTAGILCIMAGLFGMLIKNPPGELPWPQTQPDWQVFTDGVWAMSLGFVGFAVLALVLTRYLPKIPIARRLVLRPPDVTVMQDSPAITKQPMESFVQPQVQVGVKGVTISQLRPSGIGRFGRERVNVVSRGEFIDENKEIIVESIEGNNIVVKEIYD